MTGEKRMWDEAQEHHDEALAATQAILDSLHGGATPGQQDSPRPAET
jgi:hypothetical protein